MLNNKKSDDRTSRGMSDHLEKYAFDQPVLEWIASEYIKHPRGPWWFLIMSIIVFMIVIYAIFTNSWSTAIVFLVLAGVVYLQHHQNPRQIHIIVSEIGIKVDRLEFPFSNIKYFWMVYNPPYVKTLHIVTSNRFMPEITIQLGAQDPAALRNYLVQQIPEIAGRDESFTNLLTRIFKLL